MKIYLKTFRVSNEKKKKLNESNEKQFSVEKF